LFDTLDIINCGFIKVNPDATLTGDTVLRNVRNFILPKAHEHGDYVIMTISTSETGWADIARSPELINKLGVNIVQMINDYGFDGVDIDWECPTLEEKANFTSMMSVIYAKVKANNPHHLVTAAIGGGRWQAPLYDLENSQYYLDYINMMTYSMGFSGGNYQNALYPRTTFHNDLFKAGKTLSYCSIDDSVAFFQNNYHVPGGKIIVGLAFYGMKQVSSGDSNWSKAGSIFYHEIVKDYLNNSLYQDYYDEVSCVPYLISNDGTVFISYDNETSVKAKCQYVLDKGLGGVMYWENGTDLTGTLLSAVKEGLTK
jgi:chitinase